MTASKRAVLRERMEVSPPMAARTIAAILDAARNGHVGGRDGALALASLVAHARREGAHDVLVRLRDAAADDGLAQVVDLLADAPPHRSLARLGRMPEVCFQERGMLRPWPPCRWDLRGDDKWQQMARVKSPHGVSLLGHSSPILIRRILRRRWLPLRHVLIIASRRPSVEAVAQEIVCHDGWMLMAEVREALVKNPFTATALVLALLPTVSAALLRQLAAGENAHPQAVAFAVSLLGPGFHGPLGDAGRARGDGPAHPSRESLP